MSTATKFEPVAPGSFYFLIRRHDPDFPGQYVCRTMAEHADTHAPVRGPLLAVGPDLDKLLKRVPRRGRIVME